MRETLSIVVPVYNEAKTVEQVIRRLLEIALPLDREIIVVNDGSLDGTERVLEGLRHLSGPVQVLHVPKNRGKGHAVRLGICRARGTIVVIQDADLELDPGQLARLVLPILEGDTNVVFGTRFLTVSADVPLLTIVANRFLTALTNLLFGSRLTDMECCYKLMRTYVARRLILTADRFEIDPEITARLLMEGQRIVELPVAFRPRSRAAGKKIGWGDGLAAIRALFRYRFLPPAAPSALAEQPAVHGPDQG